MMNEFENTPMMMTAGSLDLLINNSKKMISSGLNYEIDESDFNYSVSEGIAIINIDGALIHNLDYSGWGVTGYNYIIKAINQANNDGKVSGILLNINSGGGTVAGCDEAGLCIEGSFKPVWAVANECAASAAYWLACSSSKIYLPKTGEVGSVGVVMSHVSYKEALRQEGIEHTFIYSGNKKVDGNPYNPLTDEVKAEFKKEIDMIRNLFVAKVAKNRKMSNDDVMNTEAGMFTGDEAVKVGFADKIGTLSTALSDMKSFLTKSPDKGIKGASMDNQVSPNAGVSLEQAKLDGATAERMRIDAVLNSSEAKGREAQATNLALKTNMSATEITSLLATFPVSQKADTNQSILNAMSVGANAPSVINENTNKNIDAENLNIKKAVSLIDKMHGGEK